MPKKKQTEKDLETEIEIVGDEVNTEEPEIEVVEAKNEEENAGIAPEDALKS